MRSHGKKTLVAAALAGRGRFPAKKVADTLEVSRSQVYTVNKDGKLEDDGHRKMTPLRPGKRGRYKMPDDDKYLPLIRQIIDERPTYGYPRVTAILNRMLRRKGEPVINPKRVYRIMSINNLLLQKHTGRPVRTCRSAASDHPMAQR